MAIGAGETIAPANDAAGSTDSARRARDVSVVIVSYEGREDLERCLTAVQDDSTELDVEVFVVDNASTDGSQAMVAEMFPSVALIVNEHNLGFSAANNQALRRYSGRYAFLLNPDAFLTPGALNRLVTFMDEHPAVGASGPKLLNRDGSLQCSIRRFPSLKNAAFETFFLQHLVPGLTSRYGEVVVDARAYVRPHAVEWLSGAAMFVRRDTIDRVGMMDESFFLFAEEIDWFKRMHDAGIQVWFDPEAIAFHRDSEGGVNPNLVGQNAYARDQYWNKHSGRSRAFIARCLLVAYMSLRLVVWLLVGLSGTEHSKKQFLAYRRGLSDLFARRSLAPGGVK